MIRYCETFQARRPATRHRYFREVRCFFSWCVAAGFLDHTLSYNEAAPVKGAAVCWGAAGSPGLHALMALITMQAVAVVRAEVGEVERVREVARRVA